MSFLYKLLTNIYASEPIYKVIISFPFIIMIIPGAAEAAPKIK
jgi:hypothetical protein